MDFTKNLDLYLDPKIIFEIYPMWGRYLALLGFLLGLITAYILWYRSARRIEALKKEQDELRVGDIEIKNLGKTSSIKPAPVATISPVAAQLDQCLEQRSSVEPTVDDGEQGRGIDSVRPADPDDLTLLEGIDDDRASDLNRAGIYKISQLQGLDEDGRRKIGFKFGWPNINWGAWEAIAAGTGLLLGRESKPVVIGNGFDPEPQIVTFDKPVLVKPSNLGTTIDSGVQEAAIVPIRDADFGSPTVNTSTTDVIDDKAQLLEIDEEQISGKIGAIAAGTVLLSGHETKSESIGNNEDPEPQFASFAQPVSAQSSNWVAATDQEVKEAAVVPNRDANFMVPAAYTSATEEPEDLMQIQEIDEKQVSGQIEVPDFISDSLSGLGALGADLDSSVKEENDEVRKLNIQTPLVALSEEAGAKFSVDIPEGADDFTLLEGIDEEMAAELYRAEIYKFSELENLDEEQREAFSNKFKFNDVSWGKWTGLAGLDAAGGLGASLLVPNDKSEIDLPTVYAVAPEDSDDLTQSEGINEEVAEITLSPAKLKGGLSNETEKIQLPDLNGQELNSDWKWGYTFKEKPIHEGDLTKLKGITSEDAAHLNSEGVYTFKHVDNLSEEKLEEEKSKFGWGDIDFGKWDAASGVASSVAGVVKREENITTQNLTVSPAGTSTFTVGSVEDEAAISATNSPSIKAQTLAVDTSDKFGELALTRDEFSKQIAEHFEGDAVKIHPRYGIVYENHPHQVDDLTAVIGLGPAAEKLLNKSGIYRFKQIAGWNAGVVERISNDLNLGTRIRDDEWISQAAVLAGGDSEGLEVPDDNDYQTLIRSKYDGENVVFKPGLGVLYSSPPLNPDDLTEVKGIGDLTAIKLNECGVYKFSQLADWNERNVAAFNNRLGYSGRIEKDQWIAQAAKLAASYGNSPPRSGVLEVPPAESYNGIVSKFKGENVKVDPKLGVIYLSQPEQIDDLKRIWGIGNRIESCLNENGVYRFSQIADWNSYNISEFDEKLKLNGRIERDDWILQASNLVKEGGELQKKFAYILSGEFAGEPVTINREFGVVYTRPPKVVDDLTEIKGIGPITEKQLNEVGIYTFKQIANWDESTVEAVEDEINSPGRVERDQWIRQAKDYVQGLGAKSIDMPEQEPDRPGSTSYLETLGAFDGEIVEVDENFGVVYTGRPTVQDDLKRIRGIGKFLESQLNDRGVYRFKQIASWNSYNVWAFGKDLAFPGRISREQWVSQAAEFAELEDYKLEAERLAKTMFGFESVKVDPELGIVYRKKPALVDDLTQLPGIDSKAVSRLNSDGIFTFAQVKSLKGPQRKIFASRFGLGDIDWAKWSGMSTLGAKGEEKVATAKEIKVVLVKPKLEPKVREVVVESDDLPTEDPKGIFGSAEDFERVFGGVQGKPEDRRIVFIMDVSRSLTPAQLRLSKTELSAAVCALPEGSLYQVIFFSGPTWFAHQRMVVGGARGEDVVIADGAKHLRWNSGFGGFEYEGGNNNLPGGEWREANPETISATLADIEAVGKSYGTTWHLPLTMAFNIDPVPKCIYFLTDGETARQEQVAEEMVEMARERGGETQINTIALMVPGASVPLYRIAKETGGEYSLVIAGGKVLKDDDLREYLSEKGIVLDD